MYIYVHVCTIIISTLHVSMPNKCVCRCVVDIHLKINIEGGHISMVYDWWVIGCTIKELLVYPCVYLTLRINSTQLNLSSFALWITPSTLPFCMCNKHIRCLLHCGLGARVDLCTKVQFTSYYSILIPLQLTLVLGIANPLSVLSLWSIHTQKLFACIYWV